MNKLEVLAAFEAAALDPLPTGLEAAVLLDRIKSIETTIAEIRAHYKDVIAKDSSAVPGWWLSPEAIQATDNRPPGSLPTSQ